MTPDREPIHVALFAKLSAIAGLQTVSRKLKHWSDTPPAEQPALFQAYGDEEVSGIPKLPRIWLLKFAAYLYVTVDGPDVLPSTLLNSYLGAIQTALAPDDANLERCTLGGLVQHCWIEGRIETDEGTLGSQAVAIVPILIKVTGY